MDIAQDSKSASGMVDDVMPSATDSDPDAIKATSSDVRDMWRMGKVQELKVRPSTLSLYTNSPSSPASIPHHT
jgi:hypothetical protein